MHSLSFKAEFSRIWGAGPTGNGADSSSLIAKVLLSLLSVSRLLSPSVFKNFFLKSKAARREFMDVYVLAWVFLLAFLLFYEAPRRGWWVPFLAAWEVVDILLYRLYFVFLKSRPKQWTSGSIRRTLVMAVLNLVEIILGFAILYRSVGNILNTQAPASSLSAISALYFSLVTVTTVGFGDFIPADDATRLLVCAEIVSGMLMLILILPALISIVSSGFVEQQ